MLSSKAKLKGMWPRRTEWALIGHERFRRLHLAPPFLLDDYTPRYQTLSAVEASEKRSLAYAHLRNCNLCPRLCGVNRYEKAGMCLIKADVKVNVIAPHFGEGEQVVIISQ
jgi:putative pyruvate formate lyase activating enzyme